jgi:hypothetical protein
VSSGKIPCTGLVFFESISVNRKKDAVENRFEPLSKNHNRIQLVARHEYSLYHKIFINLCVFSKNFMKSIKYVWISTFLSRFFVKWQGVDSRRQQSSNCRIHITKLTA